MAEVLWAPWRMAYIQGAPKEGETGGDIFVDLPARGDDRTNLILYRGERAFVMLNAYPYTSGHLMVAPYRQVADVGLMTDAEHLEIGRLLGRCVAWIRECYSPDGFNLGVNMGRAAGAGIPNHLHWHVVPRWGGDTNFMTATAGVRVIPEGLPETYERLAAVVARDV